MTCISLQPSSSVNHYTSSTNILCRQVNICYKHKSSFNTMSVNSEESYPSDREEHQSCLQIFRCLITTQKPSEVCEGCGMFLITRGPETPPPPVCLKTAHPIITLRSSSHEMTNDVCVWKWECLASMNKCWSSFYLFLITYKLHESIMSPIWQV